mgnify:FL=1
MGTQIIAAAGTLGVMVSVGAVFQMLHGLNKKLIYEQPVTMEEQLYKIARVTGKSEYDVFCKAAENWPISRAMIERDFKAYLLHQNIPYYVVDFVRQNKKHIDELHMPLF